MIEMYSNEEQAQANLPIASEEVQEIASNYWDNFEEGQQADFTEFAGEEHEFEEGDNMLADFDRVLTKYGLNPEEYGVVVEVTARVVKL